MLMPLHRNPTGGNHVYGNSERRELRGHAAAPTILGALGSDVGAKIRDTARHDLGADVDDPAPALLFHVGQASSRQQKRTFHEKVQHALVKSPVVILNR